MEKTLKEIIKILENTREVKAYALIGGLAVGGWIAPRATKDIDILADLSVTNRSAIEEVLKKLLISGFKGRLETGGPEDDIKFCIKAISREDVPVDIIFTDRKWEGEIVENGMVVEVLKGLSIPLVRPEGLITLKLRAGSFQDVADASKLLLEADYDLQRLRNLAKRARVDKRLERLMEKLGLL
ncbi:MAG: nucleotidyl transferase AbiEii/AbiGii toxin family protein [Deltaproteobacteria bacterium]|nr:nucleotidyl transferase AbiEii/AbiGii toxin family protein [Deltaproteobacteria bacterium]